MKIYRPSMQAGPCGKARKLPGRNGNKSYTAFAFRLIAAFAVVVICISAGANTHAAVKQKGFATPENAVKALAAAMKSNDEKELQALFGATERELISSGDAVSDKQRRERFISAYEEKSSIMQEGAKRVLVIGEKAWPFPIPLVKRGEQWIFDTQAGREEILNRRIGENELSTVQTLLAVVDAQREYAMLDHDNDGIREYAEKFGSDRGMKNGLYWEKKQNEEPSPLGELVADARAEGYKRTGPKQTPIPFHGYYFRMLKKQGKHATGGEFDYVVKNNLIGGFAAVAYPAVYGSSGVMTFMVNHNGAVYEKNLGKDTEMIAKEIKSFDPDKTWKKVE